MRWWSFNLKLLLTLLLLAAGLWLTLHWFNRWYAPSANRAIGDASTRSAEAVGPMTPPAPTPPAQMRSPAPAVAPPATPVAQGPALPEASDHAVRPPAAPEARSPAPTAQTGQTGPQATRAPTREPEPTRKPEPEPKPEPTSPVASAPSPPPVAKAAPPPVAPVTAPGATSTRAAPAEHTEPPPSDPYVAECLSLARYLAELDAMGELARGPDETRWLLEQRSISARRQLELGC